MHEHQKELVFMQGEGEAHRITFITWKIKVTGFPTLISSLMLKLLITIPY